MADNRTAAQKAADDNLTKAVDAVCEAYGYVDETTINTQYMLLVDQLVARPDGEDEEGFAIIYKDGRMTWGAIFGLVARAELRTRQSYGKEHDL